MPDHDDRPAPPPVAWESYKLRAHTVRTAVINAKHCRVSELGEGYMAIEVDGLKPCVTEEPLTVCLLIAEKSADAGLPIRRFVAADGTETYR